jgi:predicted  nucleic acid-binding Zn-ribbon protein
MAIQLQPIFLTEAATLALELEKIINEEFSVESFMTWATRKLKGYSVAEIDHLARRVVNIKTHEEKTDCIARIQQALREAREKMSQFQSKMDKKKEEDNQKLEYMKEHMEVLNQLLSRANGFNILSHLDAEKAAPAPTPEDKKKTFNINNNT